MTIVNFVFDVSLVWIFFARTVITGDPNLELDEEFLVVSPRILPIPNVECLLTFYLSSVAPHIAYLQELVRNGPTAYPGA
jgi:DNA-directed RNA polymerase II subunit RPB1